MVLTLASAGAHCATLLVVLEGFLKRTRSALHLRRGISLLEVAGLFGTPVACCRLSSVIFHNVTASDHPNLHLSSTQHTAHSTAATLGDDTRARHPHFTLSAHCHRVQATERRNKLPRRLVGWVGWIGCCRALPWLATSRSEVDQPPFDSPEVDFPPRSGRRGFQQSCLRITGTGTKRAPPLSPSNTAAPALQLHPPCNCTRPAGPPSALARINKGSPDTPEDHKRITRSFTTPPTPEYTTVDTTYDRGSDSVEAYKHRIEHCWNCGLLPRTLLSSAAPPRDSGGKRATPRARPAASPQSGPTPSQTGPEHSVCDRTSLPADTQHGNCFAFRVPASTTRRTRFTIQLAIAPPFAGTMSAR